MKKSRKLLLVPALLAASITSCLAAESAAGLSINDRAPVDAVVDRYVDEGAQPFVYVRLEDRDGRVIYEHAAVNRDLVGTMPINGDTWIRIWSMSKIVTISVVLDLVEDGVLSLSDRVVTYIPEFADLQVAVSATGEDLSLEPDKENACPLDTQPAQYGMTVLDLINHRAGFFYPSTGIDCLDKLAMDADLPAAANSQDLVDRMAQLPLINQPGTTHYYGTGTTVLGLVAERASGKSLNQLVEERVTGPMEISGLQYGLPEGAQMTPQVTGKGGQLKIMTEEDRLLFGTVLPDYNPDHALYLGGEGMVATADGYADFARMLLNRGELNGYRMLEPATIEDMVAPHTQLHSDFGHNGYNFWISNGKGADGETGPAPLWIGGGYEGTHFWIDPENGFVGVVMSQVFEMPEMGWGRDEAIRKALYEQLGL